MEEGEPLIYTTERQVGGRRSQEEPRSHDERKWRRQICGRNKSRPEAIRDSLVTYIGAAIRARFPTTQQQGHSRKKDMARVGDGMTATVSAVDGRL